MMLAAAGLFRRLGTNVPPSQPTTLIATTGPYRWTRNPMYLGMALIYAGLAIGFDGPIAFALLPLVLIAIQTQVIAVQYLESIHPSCRAVGYPTTGGINGLQSNCQKRDPQELRS